MRFKRCAYLQFNEQLICFGLKGLGASSITALFNSSVKSLPLCLTVDDCVQLSMNGLLINGRLFIDMADAVCYEPGILGNATEGNATESNASHSSMAMVQHKLLADLSIPSAGLAPILHLFKSNTIDAGSIANIEANENNTELISFVSPSIIQLIGQIQINCSNIIDSGLPVEFDHNRFYKLIGAGPGLTPSGDDFLCGVFSALHLSDLPEVAMSLWLSIRATAYRSTTPVSFALMEQSANGESSERLDAIIGAYFSYPKSICTIFQQLIENLGETSGWDWLAGFVVCCHTLSQSQTKISSVSTKAFPSQATDIW